MGPVDGLPATGHCHRQTRATSVSERAQCARDSRPSRASAVTNCPPHLGGGRRLPYRHPVSVANNRLSRPISVVGQPSDACHATAAATRRPTPPSCQHLTLSGGVQGLDGGLLPPCVRVKWSRSASRSRASRRTLAPTSNSTSTSWGPNLSRRSTRLTMRATGSCAHRRRNARSSSPSRRVTTSTRRTTSSSPTAAANSPQLIQPFSTTS